MEGIEEQEIPQPAAEPEGIPEAPEQIVEDLKDEITKDIESTQKPKKPRSEAQKGRLR